MKIQIKLLALIALALLSIKSYSQSITFTPAVIQQSNTFKSLVGQDRKTDFQNLQSLIVSQANTRYLSNASSITLTTETEIITLLGQPDSYLSPTVLVYNLKTNGNSCKASVTIDATGQVLYTSIYDCD